MSNSKSKKTLFKNTIMLYVLQFSAYFFSFITTPYQTRIMGPSIVGQLGFAAAMMVYFQLFMDFGFMLSATAEISRHREDKAYISRLITSVNITKIIFCIVSFVILLIIAAFSESVKEDMLLYFLYFAGTAVNTFIPDYLYRGLEKMSIITIRTVVIKLFFTVLIFVFLKEPGDYYVVPFLLLLGNIASVMGVFVHMKTKLGVWFCRVSFSEIFHHAKEASGFFLSRIATTIYSSANTIILGAMDPSKVSVGYYTSAEKLMVTAKNGVSPISDSIYPYMINNKDFKLVKKILTLLMPVIGLGCIVVFIFAEPLCAWFFGKEFAPVGNVLRALLPVIFVILPQYMLGFPTLSAVGLQRYANYSIYVGCVVDLIALIVLFVTGNVNAVTLALTVSLSEITILIFRIIVIIRNRKLFASSKKGENDE